MNFLFKIRMKQVQRHIRKGKANHALKILNHYADEIPDASFYKGVCYFEMMDLERARLYLELALSKKNDYNIASVLAKVYLFQKEWDQVLEVLKPYRDMPEVKQMISIMKYNIKDREKYVQYMNMVSKSMKHLQNKQYKESVSCLEESLDYIYNKEERGKTLNQIGGIYWNFLKDKEKAEYYFQEAHQLIPENKIYKKNLIKVKTG